LNKLLLFILVSTCLTGYAQIDQTKRYESPIGGEFQSYSVAPLDTSGVLIYRRYSGPQGDQLELVRLDTAFQEVWKGYLPIERDLLLLSVKIHRGKIYLFLRSTSVKPNFTAIAINATTGAYLVHDIKNLIAFNPSEYIVTSHALLIGGYFNYRPLLLHYSLQTKKSRVLPGFLDEPAEINQIYQTGDDNMEVIVSARKSRRRSLWIRTFDREGDLVKTVVLEPSENKSLIFGRAAKVNNDTLVIAGVYGRNAEYSRGIFVADVNAYGEYVVHYYNFGDLKNFFHYMKPRREQRIKERIERRKVKGKKIKFNYRVLVHQLVPFQDNFVMLGEAFLPRYVYRRTNSNFLPGYNSPYAYAPSSRYFTPYRNDMVLDGFDYTHAVVLGIDKKGKLVWDNSFRLSDIRSYQLEQFVKIAPKKDHITLLYMNNNEIRSKEVRGSEVTDGNTPNTFQVSAGAGESKALGMARLEYWYKQNLLIYGTQVVKKPSEEATQLVFFINKVEVK
jgi:hypothetical protein